MHEHACIHSLVRLLLLFQVVRELEGLVPGEGMFARDRRYQRSLLAKQSGGRSAAEPADDRNSKAEKRPKSELSDSEQSDGDDDDECKRILESGGRERCAYFFWQGEWYTHPTHPLVFVRLASYMWCYVALHSSCNSGQ